jgi:hypothetical protein
LPNKDFDINKEAVFINKSLTTLGRILQVLSSRNGDKEVPSYGESKLTKILKSSLTYGKCKCLLIVNVTQKLDSV